MIVKVTAVAAADTAPTPPMRTVRVWPWPIAAESRVSRYRSGLIEVTPRPVGNQPVTSRIASVEPLWLRTLTRPLPPGPTTRLLATAWLAEKLTVEVGGRSVPEGQTVR